jgi:hypothetical protein
MTKAKSYCFGIDGSAHHGRESRASVFVAGEDCLRSGDQGEPLIQIAAPQIAAVQLARRRSMAASRFFFQLLDRKELGWCDLKGGGDTAEFGRISIRPDLDIRDLTICKAAGDR